MSENLILAPNTADETTLDGSDIISARFSKTHTGISNYRFQIAFNTSIEDFALDEFFLTKDDGTLLFRGLVESIKSDEGSATTTLGGHGIGYKLETSEVVYTVSNQLAHNAINDFWADETDFSPTVTPPSISNTTSNTTAQEADTTSEFNAIAEIDETDPIEVTGDSVQVLQTCFTVEAEDFDRETGDSLTSIDSDLSDGEGIAYSAGVSTREWDFTVDYTIPEDDFEIFYRNEGATSGGSVPAINWYLDDEFIARTNTVISLGWDEVFADASESERPGDISPGTHTLRVEQVVGDVSESFTATYNTTTVLGDVINGSFDQSLALSQSNIVPGSEVVSNGTTFDEGTDYDINYPEGRVTILPNAGMSEDTDYIVDYNYFENGSDIQLSSDSIIKDSETVTDGSGTEFTRGEDYRMDYDDGIITPIVGGRLDDGTSYDITYEAVNGNGARIIDVLAPADGRFTYTLDNDNGGSSGFLDGPELFPQEFAFDFVAAPTSWNITDATLTTSWDDTTNGQSIQLRLNDQTYFPNDGSQNNTSSVTTDFGSEVGSVVQGKATFSRYGSRSTATPQTGFNGQTLQSWEITFDGNDIPVITSDTFEGTQLQVAQQLHSRADMRFTLIHDKDSLPVESYRAGDVSKTLPELDIINRQQSLDLGPYFNDVTVRGRRVDGNRLSHNVSDSSEVAEFGRRHFDTVDPSLDNLNAIKIAARALLIEKIREKDKKGTLEVAPVDVSPGFSYDNPFDSGEIPIEEISYRVSNGDISGNIVFDYRVTELQLGEDIGGLRKSNRNTKLGF